MSNSALVDYKNFSPNHSGKRTYKIERITPHCYVGQCTVEQAGTLFSKKSKKASCNYIIARDGRIGLICDENNRTWCTSSLENDQKAITIECASDSTAPYKMNKIVYEKLVKLCVDICKRNKKSKLLWFADKQKTLNYKPKNEEMILSVHRWFANKSCPGDWLYNKLDDLALEVTNQLQNNKDNITINQSMEKLEDYSGFITVVYKGKDGLNVHNKPSWSKESIEKVVYGGVYTVVGRILVDGIYMYKLKSGLYITSVEKYVKWHTQLHNRKK